MGRRLLTWWRAFRYHFVPPSYLPAILGAVAAWALTGRFNLGFYLLVVLAVTVNHVSLNMTDDYFDYLHSVDRARRREQNPYSGGSGTLTGGLLLPAQMLAAFVSGYALTIACGLYLTIARGWPVLAFGFLGLFSSFFYTAPPVRYGYRGIGELSQLLNFSLVIGLGSYYVQASSLSWEAALAVLPLGFMMFSMITINEIPDESQDREGGKRTLVVRFGPKAAVWLYGASITCAYLLILIAPLAGAASYWMYLALATVPWFVAAMRILSRNYRDPAAMAPANVLTIRIHNLTGILLILGYVVQGAVKGRSLRVMIVPLALLLLLYLPVAAKVFSRSRRPAASAER
jgi:1,4-dihydroxy-2-naphthoate octaprenyltransferase